MGTEFLVTQIEKATIVEFQTPSLMDPMVLDSISSDLVGLVDEMDRRILILDFSRVEYLSSQAIGIVITLHRKLAALAHSKLLLCGVKGKLVELLRITRLDRILTVKPTQKEAVNAAILGYTPP